MSGMVNPTSMTLAIGGGIALLTGLGSFSSTRQIAAGDPGVLDWISAGGAALCVTNLALTKFMGGRAGALVAGAGLGAAIGGVAGTIVGRSDAAKAGVEHLSPPVGTVPDSNAEDLPPIAPPTVSELPPSGSDEDPRWHPGVGDEPVMPLPGDFHPEPGIDPGGLFTPDPAWGGDPGFVIDPGWAGDPGMIVDVPEPPPGHAYDQVYSI